MSLSLLASVTLRMLALHFSSSGASASQSSREREEVEAEAEAEGREDMEKHREEERRGEYTSEWMDGGREKGEGRDQEMHVIRQTEQEQGKAQRVAIQ